MTDRPAPTKPPQRTPRLSPERSAEVLALLATEEAHTGRRPLDEVNRLALTAPPGPPDSREHWLFATGDDLTGYAVVTPDGSAELSAVNPDTAVTLLTAVASAYPEVAVWTHGDRSAGHAAARALGFTCVRELVLLARALPPDTRPRPLPGTVTVSSFDVDRDPADWLELNRRAFAALPDQAAWTRTDLDLRLNAPWYRSDDFLIARGPDGDLAGFHWTKVDPGATAGGATSGEVFVIAVAPAWRGTGLGAALLDLGLWHLSERGMTQAHLFVDSDNTAAIGLYEAAGFTRVDSDRRYVATTTDAAGRNA